MNIKQFLHKAFFGGIWYVGYRKKIDPEDRFSLVQQNDQHWIADPFLFEYDGQHYLFVEYIHEQKGTIAYYQFIDGKPVFQKIIINESYHLSYPCVFEYGGKIYIIPESADNNTIDLYCAEKFPDKWKKSGTLSYGRYYDSTVLKYRDDVYLFTYTLKRGKYELLCFKIDFYNMKLERVSGKVYERNEGRPAGNFIYKDGKLLRPAQDCTIMYGERVFLKNVVNFKNQTIIEEDYESIDVRMMAPEFNRLHTYNMDSKYVVVDFFKEKISFLRPFKLIIKKMKQKR